MDSADGLRCTLNYNADLFTAASAERILGHFATLLEAAVAAVDRPVAELPLLTTEERHLVLDVWGRGPRRPAGADAPIHHRFEANAAAVPHEVAARDGTRALTYQQLNELANRVAHYLRARGATPGSVVGVCLSRSVEMVATLLGVLKAGAAYLPVDPDYPAAWREGVLADAAADLVVADELWRDPALHAASSDDPGVVAAPSDPAYVIYTSGSTGRPKGVAVPHAALANVLSSLAAEPGFAAGESLLAVTPISFDIAAAELFLPLLVGGRVRIADRRTATDGTALARLIADESPAVLQATPSTWRLLVESGWAGHRGLRAWSGGETLTRPLADALFERCDSVWNLYGPTETTIWSTVARVERADQGPVPIGRPIAQTDVHVVDAAGQPVPANVPGELLIAGAGVAVGYLHRPELTADRFGSLPGAAGGARVYRSGDLVYYRPDGQLVHLRRLDNQVKLRGHRIELGEIETRLAEHPQVRAAAAAVHGDGVDARLVAYVEAGVPPPEPDALRAFLADRLPAHLVPPAIVVLDRLPLTSNGKLDRAQLPAPLPPTDVESSRDEPLDQKAATLVRLWEEILDRRPIGVHDDFFALGGYSLLAARLIARINHDFDWHLPVSVLFEAPTVARLAEVLRRGATSRFTSSLIPLQPEGQGPPLFLVARFSALGFRGLVRYLGRDRPIYALVPPGPDNGATPLASIEALAAHYISEMRRVQPTGPYVIAGYSFGAFPAYEAARQLDQAGEAATVVLIDGGVHLLPRHVSGLPAHLLWRLRMRHVAAVVTGHGRELRRLPPRRWLPYLAAQSRLGLRRRLVPFHADASTPQAVRDVERANKTAFATYRPGRFAGPAIAIRSAHRTDGFDDPRAGWATLIGDFREVSIPDSTHTTILDEPHVSSVVACLRATVVPTRTV